MAKPEIVLDDAPEETQSAEQGDKERNRDEQVVALLRTKDESAILTSAKNIVMRAFRGGSGHDPAELVRVVDLQVATTC
jgi:hypothetical protein